MITAALVLAVLALAFANGANDNFKGVATLCGSGTLTCRRALAWATLTTFAGSLSATLLSGGLVKRFSGKGLVADAVIADPRFLVAVAVGAAGAVLLATRFGFPISTTHALTGGLVGAGMVLAGPQNLGYATLGTGFVVPLLFSPLLSLVLAAALYMGLRWTRKEIGVEEETCICVGGVEQLATAGPGANAVRLSSGIVVSLDSVERCQRRYNGAVLGVDAQTVLDRLHVLSGGAVGFARGLNDTPKIAALLLASHALGAQTGMVLLALFIVVGGLLGGRRVARTMAFGITGMNHGQGFTANLTTACLVALASPLGLPVSTTHVSCGALFGIGAASGEARWRTIGAILSAWTTTLPVAAALSAAAAAAF